MKKAVCSVALLICAATKTTLKDTVKLANEH